MPQSDTIELHTGEEVTVEHVGRHEEGARFELTADDGRQWRVHVDPGGGTRVLTTWRDGELADLERPDWLLDVTGRLAVV